MRRFKDILVFSLLVILSSAILPIMGVPASADIPDWTISGDTVYVNDSNVYLAAQPHTLSGSGWVEFSLLSKNYEGEIDAVWGFNQAEGIIPSQPEIWAENVAHVKYRMVGVEKQGNVTVGDITYWELLSWNDGIEPDIGNYNNTNIISLTLYNSGDEIDSWESPLVVAFNSYVQHDASSATFYYSYDTQERESYVEYYDDWRAFNVGAFTTIERDYLGCNDWRFTKLDASIQKNKLYKVRCWIEVPFKGTERVQGKYIWAVKPHSESLESAILAGHLYLLDPWYDGDWNYRETITIDHAYVNGTQAYFPVYIDEHELNATFWAEVQNDGEDIVFTSDDGVSKLRRELVSIDTLNETMECHVRVPSVSGDVNTTVYLYYGNVGATEVNSEYTWDEHYKFVSHMNDLTTSTIKDSTSNGNDGDKLSTNNPIEAAGLVGRAQDFSSDYINLGNDATLKLIPQVDAFTLECLAKISGEGTFVSKAGAVGTARQYQLYVDATGINAYLGGNNSQYNGSFLDSTWRHIALTVPAATTGQILYVNGSAVTWDLNQGIGADVEDAQDVNIGGRTNGGYLIIGLECEVRISDIARPPGHISTTHNTLMDSANFYHVGSAVAVTYPTVDNSNVDVDGTNATFTGNTTDTGYPDTGGTCDERGFVWDDESHADPGDTAPGASAYDDSWTETGDFGTGEFTHDITGLTPFTNYCFRAVVHNAHGWVYSDEICFYAVEAGKVYLELRPDLDETLIRGNGGIPSDVTVGIYDGYSLPIWSTPANQYEELMFIMCVPDRWDGESDILLHIGTALANANEDGHYYKLNLTWEHYTENEDVVPVTGNTILVERFVHSDNQYETYLDWQHLDYDIDIGDEIKPDDIIALRIRRDAIGGQETDLDGELIIVHVAFLFARGDLLGNPSSIVVESELDGLIDDFLEGDRMAIGFMILCLGLMIVAYIWKKQAVMVGAGFAWTAFAFYNRSITPEWGAWDVYEWLFWLGVAMAILCFTESVVLARKVITPGEELSGEDVYANDYNTMMDKVDRMSHLGKRRRSRRDDRGDRDES